ncbi:repulsive guidance molecule B [Salmo salar]|uniref:Repulsive guidance molecule B n=1 Tax=Salmo salar TaxID=8030 RepID=A0A1S3PF37_SALSA|nr:repulsive guidance molecule B [Salmo salar]|eukprot:XP_014026226.1 PREDICTED: RGM domain family member B-like [Salmo salar]
MGRAGCCYRGAERLASSPSLRPLVLLIVALCYGAHRGHCQVATPQCRIQKCTTDFVSLTSHLTPALDGFDVEFCKALRSYSACTQRTAKSCRGNLVFHSAVLGISDLMTQRNCSRDGPTSSTHPEIQSEPCNYHSRTQHTHPHPHAHAHPHSHTHTPSRPGYLFCGLFGDPHLRTFKDSFQTCKVEGAWPLIDNDFLSVQVTNVPVVTGSSATATNKITIIFKPFEECTDQRVYQAVTDDLPAAFVDGTVSSGDPNHNVNGNNGDSTGKVRALWISERSPGHHVELHAGYIGVTVIVRQLGRYLTLAVRIPEEMAHAYDATQDLQLCLNGCPTSERIDRGGHLPLPLPLPPPALGLHLQQPHGQGKPSHTASYSAPQRFSVEGARARCREQLELQDIYFHSCVFDLLTTGDANFTAAAFSALKDMESLHPHRERWRIFPQSSADTSQPIAWLLRLTLFALGSALV